MRRLTLSCVATSVAIALASTAALAQLQIQPANPGTNATAAPTGAATPSGSTVSGGCVGTGGSTCTATTSSAPTAGTTDGAAPSGTASGNVTTPASSDASTPPAASSGASASRPFTPDSVSSPAADAPFRTTPNTPAAMPTGAALGRSPGQTSSGTAAGNSSRGIDAGSQNLGTVNPATTNLGNTALVPGVTVGGTTGVAGAAGGVNANGERAGIVVADDATPPTPLFELTARQGAEREARRRARGEEPRVYGIAPRTDRDLTHQMPDDPVIRY